MGLVNAPAAPKIIPFVPKIKEKAPEIIGRVAKGDFGNKVAGFIPIFMGSFMDFIQSIGAPSMACDSEVADYVE